MTGVLLVMGFVVIGSTLVQIQTLEESTSRLTRESVIEIFDEVISKFNDTMVSGAQKAETNLIGFEDRSSKAAARLRDAAIGRGLYMTTDLDADPDNDIFWRDGRCGAWSDKSTGAIVGYDRASRAETIVGAVYDVYVTNGDQSLAAKYYVKFFDCMLTTTTSFVDSYTVNVGEGVTGFDGAKAEDDGDAAATFEEELVATQLVADTRPVLQSSITKNRWEDQGSIKMADGAAASLPYNAAFTDDHISFKLDPEAFGDNAVWQDLVITLDAWRAGGVWVDDAMKLEVTYNGQTIGPYTVPATAVDQNDPWPTVSIPTNPLGAPIWTKAMIQDAVWKIYIDEGVSKDLNVVWYIDFARVTGERGSAQHELDVELDFGTIPPLFTTNEVDLRYRVGTETETFTFQVWDGSLWNTRAVLAPPALDTWTSSTSSGSFPYTLTAAEFNDGKPRFRLLDDSDADPTLASTLNLDYLKITSVFQPPS